MNILKVANIVNFTILVGNFTWSLKENIRNQTTLKNSCSGAFKVTLEQLIVTCQKACNSEDLLPENKIEYKPISLQKLFHIVVNWLETNDFLEVNILALQTFPVICSLCCKLQELQALFLWSCVLPLSFSLFGIEFVDLNAILPRRFVSEQQSTSSAFNSYFIYSFKAVFFCCWLLRHLIFEEWKVSLRSSAETDSPQLDK